MAEGSYAKPLASISLDLDNLWSYLKIHGDAGWEKYPSYLDILTPYVLDIFDQFKLRITFFVVGKDVLSEKNIDFLRLINKSGHEVGNHSFHHDPWLHLYSKDRIEREISQTEDHIFQVTGQKPLGFRGPGFSWSKDLLEILFDSGYMYDSTTMPTFIGPVARAYYFRSPKLSSEEKNRRKHILGFREGMRPINPYCWKLPLGGKMLEIPVTTVPIIKTPFHMSYLLFLGRFSVFIMFL
jgi:peptidoglycan/xylan/chitin deacetylase (PgdA/CDA1 family)